MLIDSIVINNFRQYKGQNKIQFSTNPEKNVTIITGENTCGKTTLVQSFIWCLYGSIDFKDKEILNAEVKDDLLNGSIGSKKEASVGVTLSHNGKDYLIIRRETYELNHLMKILSNQNVYIYEIDQYKSRIPIDEKDFDKIVNDILPENLSDYFFFWGERIEKLSEQKELQGAVKQFLGLDTIDAAIRHLKKAKNKLTRDAATNTNDSAITTLQEKIDGLIEKDKQCDVTIDSCNSNITYYKNEIDRLYKQLTTSENQKLQEKQDEFKQKSKGLEINKKDLENKKNRFNRMFNDANNYVYLFARNEEKHAVELLKNNPEPVIGWNYINVDAINEILKKGKCICGSEFCEGDHLYKNLIEQKKIVAPNVIGGVVNSFVEESERRQNSNLNYYEDIHRVYSEINDVEEIINDLQFDVDALRKYITGKRDMKDISKRYEETQRKLDELNQKLGRLTTEKRNAESEIESGNLQIQNLMEKNKKYKKQRRAIGLMEQVLNVFENDYKNNEQKLKSKLEYYVNQNFCEVYSGTRKIEIDDKYNAIALNKVGDKWIRSETSPGLETVKNFAFIAGLIQCAKEKIIGGDGAETEANPNHYPLVLDAPFSQADEKHIPAISKLIANNAEQIILVVMQKDWNYAKDILNDKVGKSYVLTKDSETHTNIKEEF